MTAPHPTANTGKIKLLTHPHGAWASNNRWGWTPSKRRPWQKHELWRNSTQVTVLVPRMMTATYALLLKEWKFCSSTADRAPYPATVRFVCRYLPTIATAEKCLGHGDSPGDLAHCSSMVS